MKKTKRKKATKTPTDWQKVMESAIKSSINAIAIIDLEGYLTYVNHSFLKMWGYDNVEEVMGKPIVGFWMIEDKVLRIIGTLRGKGSWTGELIARRKDGSALNVCISANMVADESGKPICLMALFIDITERKKAEGALRESEERFRLAFENAKDAIFWADPRTGTLINCNKAAEILLEKTKKEIIGKRQTIVHPPEKTVYYVEMFKKHIKEKGSIDDEAEVITKSGKIIPVHITASVTIIGEKPVIQGIFRNISERKKAEMALHESEQRWRSLVHNIPDIIITVSRDGVIMALNRTVRGFTVKETIGKSVYDYVEPEHRDSIRISIERVFETGKPDIYEVFGAGPKGPNTAWYETRVVPVMRDERVVAATLISRDVTEHKKTEAELRQAQRLASVGQLAAGVAHEINNPLSALSGELQWLLEKTKDKKMVKSLKFIDKVSDRISRIVNDLLTFSRDTSTKAEELSSVTSLVNRTLSLMERRFKLAHIKIVKKLNNGLPKLIVNRGQNEQVFMNIMLNAMDAMPNGGKLTISTGLSAAKDAVEIIFTDTGRGIPKEDLPKLFDPFFSTKPSGKGTGLGLSVSAGIVKSHGGSINISSGLDKGTKVLIRMPVKRGKGKNGS